MDWWGRINHEKRRTRPVQSFEITYSGEMIMWMISFAFAKLLFVCTVAAMLNPTYRTHTTSPPSLNLIFPQHQEAYLGLYVTHIIAKSTCLKMDIAR